MGKKSKDPLNLRVNWKYRTILIVDDVVPNYEIIKAALEPTAAKTDHAKTGLEGIRKALENKKIDVVLMDINLPGISGVEAARELRLLKPDVVIIGQSAFIVSATREQCFEAGMDDFFIKPISSAELIAIIRRALIHRNKRI